jgi:hypothetical protein
MTTREECLKIIKKMYPDCPEYMADYYYRHMGSWDGVLEGVRHEYETYHLKEALEE